MANPSLRNHGLRCFWLGATTTMVFVGLAVFSFGPASANARAVGAKITSPHPKASVGTKVLVRVHVRSTSGRFKIRYFVDGKLRGTRLGRPTKGVTRKLALRLSGAGPHRIRAVVTSRGRRAASSVRITSTGIPDPPPSTDNFKLTFYEDFSKWAATGSLGSATDPDRVVYTGTNGTSWTTYPRSYVDTYQRRPYRSDRVLSVHDGVLDYYLHPVDNRPAGANLSPIIAGGSKYQTFGRYSVRLKVDDTDLSEYYMALLLWPRDEGAWAIAESDFPEGPLTPGVSGVYAHAHFAPNAYETFVGAGVNMHEWHTYTQDWTPLVRRYYVDDKLIGVTVNPVFAGPQRWQLQIETKGNGSHSGHVLVDWAAIYSL